ncbi:MAG TPA: GAF domain-containing protein, partial [Vicinamibacterales bacterium]|nr:GAF domain-containing protein [Vicinamibacterales bacterium]
MHSEWLELALAIAVCLLGGLLIARLHKRAESERAERVRAERQARLADSLQQVAAAVSRARTAASVVEVALPEFLHAFGAAAGAFAIVAKEAESAEIVRTVGCGEPIEPMPSFALSLYPSLADALRRHEVVVISDERPRDPRAERVPPLDFIAAHESAVAVPLIAGSRAMALLVMGFREARSLAVDEVELLITA